MKPLLLITFLILSAKWNAFSQGFLVFSNFEPDLAPVTITVIGLSNPANGPPGAYLGSNYTASLFFVNGTVTDETEFESSQPVWFSPADTRFFGNTGIGPGHGDLNGDGSGFFFGGTINLTTASERNVTIQVRAWYNGGGLYSSYDQAEAAGQNVGKSNLVPVTLDHGTGLTPNLDGLIPFTVGIPEPSTFAMIGLGVLTVLFFRRRAIHDCD